MAVKRKANRKASRKKRVALGLDDLDEFGGTADGGIAIVDQNEQIVHLTSARVAASLRYFLARVDPDGPNDLPKRLALTSALLGEGVSFTTRALASVLAYDTDSTVGVVDLNWRPPKPAADPAVEAPSEPDGDGPEPDPVELIDVIEGDAPLVKAIMPTVNPRLSLVHCGELSVARRPVMAASRALESVVDDIADRFDHVLFDLPPVLKSSDTLRLTQLADAFVLVVRQGVTATSQVDAALEQLKGHDALGVILNRYTTRVPKGLRRLVGA